MPTGYTAKLHDGKPITFREFALDCSRAFGALIHMRDENQDTEIKLREVRSYYSQHIKEFETEIELLSGMTPLAIELEHAKAMDALAQAAADDRKKSNERRVRYQSMLDEVTAWEPPTPDHVEMKKFMVQQITDSMKFDCPDDDREGYHERQAKNALRNPMSWHADRLANAYRSLDRARENLVEEQQRVADANRWVMDLMESLPCEGAK